MIQLTCTNDPVFLAWLTMLLQEEDVDTVILDMRTAIVDRSIGAIHHRIMAADHDLVPARLVLQ